MVDDFKNRNVIYDYLICFTFKELSYAITLIRKSFSRTCFWIWIRRIFLFAEELLLDIWGFKPAFTPHYSWVTKVIRPYPNPAVKQLNRSYEKLESKTD